MRDDITLEEILEVSSFSTLSNVYKIQCGIVTAYYPPSPGSGPAMVDVQVAVHDVRFDTTTGERISEPWPILPKIPVAFQQGGGFALVFPMQKGDKVTLLSYDLDPTKHRGTGNAEDPIDTGRHRGAYWVALPGDITDGGAGAAPSGFVAGAIGMPLGQITFTPDGVTISTGSGVIQCTASGVSMGALPLALASGPSTFAILTAIGVFSAAIGAALSAAEPPATPWEIIMAPALTAAVNALAATINPLLPLVETTTTMGT